MKLINLLQSMYDNLDNKWNFQPELLLEFNLEFNMDLNTKKFQRNPIISIYDLGIYSRVYIDYAIIEQMKEYQHSLINACPVFKSKFYEIEINKYLGIQPSIFHQKYHYVLTIEITSPKEINMDLISQLSYSWEEYILSLDKILTSKEITEKIQKELYIE